MVPFALLPEEPAFVIHVSQLASHTEDMRTDPRVSLLVIAPDTKGTPAQAVARATIQGRAEPFSPEAPGHAAAREAYLSRFPQALDMFELDFTLFAIRPGAIRFVGGFAQAATLTPEELARALKES
jgi:putative heme iron utilization protein